VDACFLSSTWRITSRGMFAGSCIGVILLVMALEFLRRLGKEYDSLLVRKHQAASSIDQPAVGGSNASDGSLKDGNARVSAARALIGGVTYNGGFRPSVLEQAVRALLHMVQFAVAYIIML
jgi:solute carrier family 31 (copper transporter), member 1